MGNDEREPYPKFNGLPTITDATLETIIEEYGVKKSLQEVRSADRMGLADESSNEVQNRITGLTSTVVGDLVSSNRQVVEAMYGAMRSGGLTRNSLESFTVGCGIVLRAFHIETGYDLVASLAKLKPEDVETVGRTFQEVLTKRYDATIERALNVPVLPEQQINLKEAVSKVNEHAHFLHYLPMGAAVMYQALSRVWPKLYGTPMPNNPDFTPDQGR